MRKTRQGFTLIELMIVVAVVAILASIAFPSYVTYVQRSHMADAQSALLENAQFLERRFTVNNAYNTGWATATEATGNLPRREVPAGEDASSRRYVVVLTAIDANSYTLTATPENAQATDSCGTMTLTHTGARSSTGTGSGCW